MKVNQDFLFGVLVGIVALFIFNFFFKSKVSGFTLAEAEAFFPDTMTKEAALQLYQTKTQEIATGLTSQITTMVQSGKTTQEIITASHAAADQSNALNKAFASFQIRKSMTAPQ